MKVRRVVLTAVAAGALVIAAGCRSARTSSTTTTTDNGAYSSSTTVSDTSVNPAVAPPYNTTTTTTTTQPSTVAAVGTTTTDANGATTTITPNGSITRSSSTTVILPDGTVKTVNGDNATAVAGAPGTVTTRTVTTITTKTTTPPATTVVQTVPANMGYYPPPPMTSSETTIYQPPLRPVLYHGRRYPGFDFLAFATRASFSTNNRSLDGTVNTGALGTDIRNENGWGFGFNKYFGHNWSTEFTASRIQPRATLTPTNASVNPITGVRLKMTPITGTLQLHFNPRSSVDLNIGGGAAYVMFKADDSFNPGTSGLTSVKFRDEFGPLVNAGLAFNMSHNFGLRFDAKYMWIRARATTTFNDGVAVIGNVGNTEHIGLNPFVLSAGLRFGF